MSVQLRRWQGIGLSAFVLALMSLAAVPAFGQAENRQPGPEARLMASSSSQTLPLGFAQKSFPDAMVGMLYNASIEATGGSGAYALGVDGNLPPGMEAVAGAGTLNLRGLPTEAGDYKFEAFIRDLNGTSYKQEFEIRVAAQMPGALATRGPVVVDTEAFHFADADSVFFPIVLKVAESFNFADLPAETKAVQVAVVEGFHFADQPSTTESVFVLDNESLHIADNVSSAESVFIVDTEAVHISDSDVGLDSALVNDAENVTTTDTVQIAVLTVPNITWRQPAAIPYGTALSATQLSAVASVPGTYVYTPAIGTVLPAGTNVLSVTFTPTDPTTYAPTTATVNLVVNQALITVWALSPTVKYGAPVPVVTQSYAGLGLFANLRPAILYPQLADASTLKPEIVAGLDLMIVRELTGDIYFGQPRGIETLPSGERRGINTMVYTESEVERICRVAFEIAMKRDKRVCSVDKANVLECTELWREVAIKTAADYPDITLMHMYVDNAAMQLVRAPKQFDVMVTGNIFGDILSDCASMLTGSIGMLPSASLNASGQGMYEPIHGSAPDIAGRGIANPLATILSVAMMLRHSLNAPDAAARIEAAVVRVLDQGLRTADILSAGMRQVGTVEMGDAVVAALNAGVN